MKRFFFLIMRNLLCLFRVKLSCLILKKVCIWTNFVPSLIVNIITTKIDSIVRGFIFNQHHQLNSMDH